MKLEDIHHVGVLGTGMIGPDVTLLCAMNGYRVIMIGRSPESVERGRRRFEKNLRALIEQGIYNDAEGKEILSRIETGTSLPKGVASADMIIEAIAEDLGAKQDIFVQVEKYCPSHAVFASSTSGLSPNGIGAKIRRKDRMLVAHFWNPPYLVPLVELVAGEETSKETIDLILSFLRKMDKEPVLLRKDIAGHIGNRIQHAIFREAIHLVQEGVAEPEEIDAVIMSSLGPRYSMIGPMEYMDSVGINLQVAIQSYLFKSLDASKKPQKLVMDLYNRGDLGAKTGKGFYDWSKRSLDEMTARQNKRFIDRMKERRLKRK